MIYTVGNREGYLRLIFDMGTILKIGKCAVEDFVGDKKEFPDGYPGGYALRTIKDGERLIKELNRPDFAVFGLNADWERDTEPAGDGWWHYLLRDAEIIVLDNRP